MSVGLFTFGIATPPLFMSSTEHALRERIKELKCIYELSRIGASAPDLATVLKKTLKILPASMQFPRRAVARIKAGDEEYGSADFNRTDARISSPIVIGKKKYGSVSVGYVKQGKAPTPAFLTEERKLLQVVSRELSFIIQRHQAEEEKQRLKLQLQHVERLAFVGELTAGIAHELNEPLGRILGFAQLIRKGGPLNAQQEADMERILKASLYTREIIKKLMIFSRQMPPQISAVNLNETVSNILYFMDAPYFSGNIRITKKLDPDLPVIRADAVQISQVLVNLLTNAIHAMPDGGDVLISTSHRNGFVTLTVKDNGVGMTPEVKEKIFEPFFTTKPVGQGTGLGLSVVDGIVSAHGGRINVTSAPGKGSRFEVMIPVRTYNRKSKTS
nr:MAG: PAS domain-containing sensor histidine kinase [Bacteroidota bacterium]